MSDRSLHPDTGTPCDDIDLSDIFGDVGKEEDNHFSGSEREDGTSPVVSDGDSEKEEQIFEFASEAVYGVTPPRDVRRQKERSKNLKRTKEKSPLLMKNQPVRENRDRESPFLSPLLVTGKVEQERKKKREETFLTTERAAQRKEKMESGYQLNGERNNAEGVPKTADIPSIKIESVNRYMSLICEESKGISSIKSDSHSSCTTSLLSPHCPEDRDEFYKTFSLLIQLGSKKQKESQTLGSVERQSSVECKRWKVELGQALWLELQAWHADKNMEQQDLHLMEARADIDAVLDEVINFKVKKFETEFQEQSLSSDAVNRNSDDEENKNLQENSGSPVCEKVENDKVCIEDAGLTPSETDSLLAVAAQDPNVNMHSGSESPSGDVQNVGKVAHDGMMDVDAEGDTPSQAEPAVRESLVEEDKDCFHWPSDDKYATALNSGAGNATSSCLTRKRGENLPSRRKVGFSLVMSKKQEIARPCAELKAAFQEVKTLFRHLERVEHLYPTLKALGEQNPKYCSEQFNRVLDILCLWFNLTEDLYHKLHVMAKFLGVDVGEKNTWQDWLDIGLNPQENAQYMSPGRPTCRKESTSSDSDGSELEETCFHNSTPCSPARNPDTPTRPAKRISGGISQWTSTSRYRPFVDRSIKRMGLSKLGKRIGDIVDNTLMRSKQALTSGSPYFLNDDATCKVMKARDSLSRESYGAILSHEQAVRDRIAGIKEAAHVKSKTWSDKFDEIGLPSFRNLYLFVTRITLDISHECLRLRLEHRPTGEPSSLSVCQLLRECKEVIMGAMLVKDYYVSMVEGILRPEDSDYDTLENSIEAYEEDLREILKVYFEYLHNTIHLLQRLPQASKGLKNLLEAEWNFVRQRCRHVRGGEVEGGTRFCVMAAGLLDSTGDFLDCGLDQCCSDLHDKTDHRDDLKRKMLEACRGFKHLVNEARERASKALGFIKKLRSDLENAAKFSIEVSNVELLAKLKDTGHVQVVTRHTAGLLMFVPKHLIEDKREIVHLLNVCCGQEESISQRSAVKEGYLVLIPSVDGSGGNTWTGEKLTVNPTVDTVISLADVQVEGLMLIVRSSKQLDSQRKLFQNELTGAVGLVRERTSSHQAIAESLNDLKEASLTLQDKIVNAIQRVDEDLVLGNLYDIEECDRILVQNTCVETMHSCYNFGFEYQKEVARLVTGEGQERLGQNLLAFAGRWMKFAMARCEKGRGTRPRWASQGLDFLTVACSPKTLELLSEAEFQDLKKEINNCICHVIGTADPSMSTSPVFKPQSPVMSPVFGKGGLLRPYSWPGKPPRAPSPRNNSEGQSTSRRLLSDPSHANFQSLSEDAARGSLSAQVIEEEGLECGRVVYPKNSCVTAPEGPRLKRLRRKLKELERQRDQNLLERHAIGRKSKKRRDIASELINITNKRVPFKWQRGNKIGEGQFGKVYACVNLDSGDLMAVKQIKFQPNDHGEIKELADEIKNFEGIKHKNLVRYYGMELHRDEMFIFMEYCADGTISDVSKVGLPETMIRTYTLQILVAISFLHDNGIVHRDIKGPNIFLSSDGLIKLGDFGSSIKLRDPFKTMHGEISNIRGTVAYMAPEVITLDKGAGYGRAADIWSVGCVVVEMATGKPPWPDCDNNWAIMYKVGGEDGKPAIPDNLSEEGKQFLDLCFQKDPHERHTANELRDHVFVRV